MVDAETIQIVVEKNGSKYEEEEISLDPKVLQVIVLDALEMALCFIK